MAAHHGLAERGARGSGAPASFSASVSAGAASAYRTHPLLDPLMPSHDAAEARRWIAAQRALVRGAVSSAQLAEQFVAPVVGTRPAHQSTRAYLENADAYVDMVLLSAPPQVVERLRLLPETLALGDVGAVLRQMFEAASARARYEAQRKLPPARGHTAPPCPTRC